MIAKPTHQDDLARMLRILSDAPTEGMSIEEIQDLTATTDDPWSQRTINSLLCDLGRQVSNEKVRSKSGKATKYSIRRAS
ncbi:hypothetical protein SAMN05444166_4213 [Singulisphaera sp. GP187]|uniref:hypothetical protein n=1 Tax=Singulisphaera sp. GP187 TaxID=1882752 RepID=UPI00092607A3|nr:hypothetical protein [Singulisphaera sp. GP187]SIO37731.1 hypothetical protein SAMN05444166_4213 [Singulisphaera sp. GP187]